MKKYFFTGKFQILKEILRNGIFKFETSFQSFYFFGMISSHNKFFAELSRISAIKFLFIII